MTINATMPTPTMTIPMLMVKMTATGRRRLDL